MVVFHGFKVINLFFQINHNSSNICKVLILSVHIQVYIYIYIYIYIYNIIDLYIFYLGN